MAGQGKVTLVECVSVCVCVCERRATLSRDKGLFKNVNQGSQLPITFRVFDKDLFRSVKGPLKKNNNLEMACFLQTNVQKQRDIQYTVI